MPHPRKGDAGTQMTQELREKEQPQPKSLNSPASSGRKSDFRKQCKNHPVRVQAKRMSFQSGELK